MDRKKIQGFEFTGKDGEFKLQQPDHSSFLYFPLVNEGE